MWSCFSLSSFVTISFLVFSSPFQNYSICPYSSFFPSSSLAHSSVLIFHEGRSLRRNNWPKQNVHFACTKRTKRECEWKIKLGSTSILCTQCIRKLWNKQNQMIRSFSSFIYIFCVALLCWNEVCMEHLRKKYIIKLSSQLCYFMELFILFSLMCSLSPFSYACLVKLNT